MSFPNRDLVAAVICVIPLTKKQAAAKASPMAAVVAIAITS